LMLGLAEALALLVVWLNGLLAGLAAVSVYGWLARRYSRVYSALAAAAVPLTAYLVLVAALVV